MCPYRHLYLMEYRKENQYNLSIVSRFVSIMELCVSIWEKAKITPAGVHREIIAVHLEGAG